MIGVSRTRIRELLSLAVRSRILVVGDVMLDQFVWGRVNRISPEAPVPVVDFDREVFMPGGAANVARNLTSLSGEAAIFGIVGGDPNADRLADLLATDGVKTGGLVRAKDRPTITKTRIVAGQQQIVRLDREFRGPITEAQTDTLLRRVEAALPMADAVVMGDYGKGVVSQRLLDGIRSACKKGGRWISLDPKPVHRLDLKGLSLLTPNRKETFELGGVEDTDRNPDPMRDAPLHEAIRRIQESCRPALLLSTLGESGMLLCRRHAPPLHIPTVAREVFDVSGAGDTVIASFTLAIAAGASPEEAAVFSNHAAGVVVGKRGTATVTPDELVASFPEVA